MAKIAETYHRWRKGKGYHGVPGFCHAASRDMMKNHGYGLTPGRYVGAEAEEEEDGTPFLERFAELQAKLEEQFAESERLTAVIRERHAGIQPG